MFRHTHHRRLIAVAAIAAALAAGAPAASARPIDSDRYGSYATAQPEPVRVVRVQVDQGLNWADTGIGAAGMLALVLIGFGAVRAATPVPPRGRSTAHS